MKCTSFQQQFSRIWEQNLEQSFQNCEEKNASIFHLKIKIRVYELFHTLPTFNNFKSFYRLPLIVAQNYSIYSNYCISASSVMDEMISFGTIEVLVQTGNPFTSMVNRFCFNCGRTNRQISTARPPPNNIFFFVLSFVYVLYFPMSMYTIII